MEEHILEVLNTHVELEEQDKEARRILSELVDKRLYNEQEEYF